MSRFGSPGSHRRVDDVEHEAHRGRRRAAAPPAPRRPPPARRAGRRSRCRTPGRPGHPGRARGTARAARGPRGTGCSCPTSTKTSASGRTIGPSRVLVVEATRATRVDAQASSAQAAPSPVLAQNRLSRSRSVTTLAWTDAERQAEVPDELGDPDDRHDHREQTEDVRGEQARKDDDRAELQQRLQPLAGQDDPGPACGDGHPGWACARRRRSWCPHPAQTEQTKSPRAGWCRSGRTCRRRRPLDGEPARREPVDELPHARGRTARTPARGPSGQ